MFDLNEPADEPLGGSKKPPAAAEEPFAGLSLLAHSAQQQQQQEPENHLQEPENVPPGHPGDENASSAAVDLSLGGGPGISGITSSNGGHGGGPEKSLQGSVGGKSARSLEMILEEDESRPEPGETMRIDDEDEPEPAQAKNLCEFLTISKLSDDSPEIDLIDAFGHEQQQQAPPPPSPGPPSPRGEKPVLVEEKLQIKSPGVEAFDDPKFGSFVWRGGLKFQEITLPNMVAACSNRWLHVFNHRKLPGELRVQRFTASDKFVSAIKEYMAEPAVRVMQRSGTSPQNLNKLVQVLAGGIDSELTLNAGVSKGPLVALIPLHDEELSNAWFADLLLLPASSLSDVEPGELSAPEEDALLGFVSASPVNPDEPYTWLKPGNAAEVDDSSAKPATAENASTGQKSKKSPEKRPEPAGDKELEEGQLEEQKEAPVYEKRKRYPEEEKKAKANGEAEAGKVTRERERDRPRHRDHERDREPERGRRERDREVDHRERDRDGVYARRGNHEYLPRLETKTIRHRDGEKDRREVNTTWENGGGGNRGPSTKERGREVERSKSREREKERPGVEKVLKETRSSKGGGGIKMPETKSKAVDGVERKRRERSPLDTHRGNSNNGKRVKESASDPKVAQLAEKLAAFTEEKFGGGGLKSNHVPRPPGKQQQVARMESEEPEMASLMNAGDERAVVDEVENEVFVEMFLENCDDETRAWLASKQNAILLREDFGVTLLRKEPSSADLQKTEREPLHIKLLVPISDTCDATEGKYFVTRAANFLRDVSRHGVFSRSLWYPGPVQPHSTSAPQLHLVVRRLKGDDGKNLDKIQDSTGVMLGLVLDADNNKKNSPGSRSAIVGVRLKTSRKKGLSEAVKRVRELLQEVSQAFAKEMNIPAEVNLIDDGNPKPPRLLFVTNIPDYASTRMIRAIFESSCKDKMKKDAMKKEASPTPTASPVPASDPGAPPGFEQQQQQNNTQQQQASSGETMVVEVRYSPEEGCAFVELAVDELIEAAVQQYERDQGSFCGLKVGVATPVDVKLYEQLEPEPPPPTTTLPLPPPPQLTPPEMKPVKPIAVESDEYEPPARQHQQHHQQHHQTQQRKGIKPLFLTDFGNETSETIKQLFEEVIATHINSTLDAKSLVLAVRHIPTRGCMFVDLATPDLVDFMLDLHFRQPEVFGRMKMELGRSHITGNNSSSNTNNGYDGAGDHHRKRAPFERSRSERNLSPKPKRRASEMMAMEDDEEYSFAGRPRKMQRSDPEKTVYADRLPENSTEAMIRRIFRGILLEHMTPGQRSELGDEVVTEVRLVKQKYCAFVVFASDDLARLALELYSRDEEIFEHMRLKPHFNSRLEDIYKGDDGDETPSNDHQQQQRDFYEFHQQESSGNGGRGLRSVERGTPAPRVDRKRSVYVDRIPDSYHEAEVKEVLERYLRRKARGSPVHAVNHVSFFRDRYDPVRVCAFVEVKNEGVVQDLIEFYAQDEEAFDGMRIRPAVKY